MCDSMRLSTSFPSTEQGHANSVHEEGVVKPLRDSRITARNFTHLDPCRGGLGGGLVRENVYPSLLVTFLVDSRIDSWTLEPPARADGPETTYHR